jgi:LysR family transcriptional regulator, glycine cleavage system transcriptional activator
MPRRLPPLNALKAFEAAARHESFTRAAEELCVTQGAVSHQVKALEAELGLKLFNRERQRLVITEAGRAYLAIVRDAFDRISDGTQRLLQRQRGGALTVSTSPNFAAKWLVHRLGRFAEVHPEIDLRISASLHHVDFAREDIDLAVRHGDGIASGLHVTRLCAEELFPVCSPKLLNSRTLRAGLRISADSRSCMSTIGKAGANGWASPALRAWIPHAARFSARQVWRSMPLSTARV